ncbi:MAG: DUF6339 family protein [Eubacteriales bacterium]|nr:DUF6339 family protein [Ruminiclostridium sp.]MDD4717609.1 DUF6339 family protein [Eubacteriales bacterium]
MKLTFLEDDSLFTLKSNLNKLYTKFASPDAKWITEYFGRSPFIETKYSVEDFSLDMSQDKPFLTEFENVQRVYNSLSFLSDSQASDERLWAGLCLNHFWEYTQYRWDIVSKCTIDSVKQHFFFGFGARRSLTRNAISRLWWIGRLTHDPSRKDPYELTRFVCENADYIMHILERNTSNSPMITKAFLSALLTAREEGCLINTDTVGELSKYLNLLGGTYILDCLPESKIHDKIVEKARSMKAS